MAKEEQQQQPTASQGQQQGITDAPRQERQQQHVNQRPGCSPTKDEALVVANNGMCPFMSLLPCHSQEVKILSNPNSKAGGEKMKKEVVDLLISSPRRKLGMTLRSWRHQYGPIVCRRRRRREKEEQSARILPASNRVSHAGLRDTFRVDWGRLVNGGLFRSVEGCMGLRRLSLGKSHPDDLDKLDEDEEKKEKLSQNEEDD